jgi:hypothetical protein
VEIDIGEQGSRLCGLGEPGNGPEAAPGIGETMQLQGKARLQEMEVARVTQVPDRLVDHRLRSFERDEIAGERGALIEGMGEARRRLAIDGIAKRDVAQLGDSAIDPRELGGEIAFAHQGSAR